MKRIGGLVQVYSGHSGELRLDRYVYQDDDGQKSGALSNPTTLEIVTTTGLPHLQSRVDSGETTCTELLSIAARDERLGRVLALIGNDPPGWHGIYDVLETIGGSEEIVEEFKQFGALINLKYLKDGVRRTANHHRHLGEPNLYPLPQTKIELHDARQLIIRMLQCWLERSRPKPGDVAALEVPSQVTDLVL